LFFDVHGLEGVLPVLVVQGAKPRLAMLPGVRVCMIMVIGFGIAAKLAKGTTP